MIPVTVVGGFLGAGKTTLVNGLLARATRRYGVLVNDFGAVNVDAGLIAARDGEMIALTNGCVCCGLGADLGEAVARLAALGPEAIMVEASGVSDPRRVAQLAALEDGVVLDAVLVLVDAAGFLEGCADPRLADTLERQVARADLLVINKCDLADGAALEGRLAELAPSARVVRAVMGAVPEGLVAGSAGPISRFEVEAPGHPFRTWHWRSDAVVDEGRLRGVVGALPRAVLRLKGVCRVGAGGGPYLVQLAGPRWSLRPWPGAVEESVLVAIGTDDLDLAALDRCFGVLA